MAIDPKNAATGLRFNDAGLVCAVVQQYDSKEVLMVAWMDAEALRRTLETGAGTYYSRSRQRLWRKGEESGNFQVVREIRLDCDNDTVLLAVEQQGDRAACHEGYESCFFRRLEDGNWRVVDQRKVDPAKYGAGYGHHKTSGAS